MVGMCVLRWRAALQDLHVQAPVLGEALRYVVIHLYRVQIASGNALYQPDRSKDSNESIPVKKASSSTLRHTGKS